ncbi:MAG: hypothetical protein QNJ29_11575 [Rhizobiaceae bacterium]|nr:hypothetical protein [Rhizobiaceae bacterium]
MFRLVSIFLLLGLSNACAVVLDGKILQQTGDGTFVILDPNNSFSVGFDNFDNDNLYAFNEDQNIVLEAPIRVDLGGTDGFIPMGEVVASHYVFFDSAAGIQRGFVEFDAPILGVAAYQDTMAATDFLANNSVTYISPQLRGLEQGDLIWIDSEIPNRLWVSWSASSPGDYIRVFTRKSFGAIG